jgi:RND family efflux transporter MFP subunit
MVLWKQLLVAALVVIAAFAGWVLIAPQTLPVAVSEIAARAGLPVAQEEAAATGRGGPGGGGPRGGPGGGPGGGGGRGGPGGAERVVTAQVSEVSSVRRVQSVGTAEAQRSVTLFSPTGGLIVEVLFETGAFVDKDQPLMRLDDREEQIAVERAQIRVQQLRDQLDRFERLSQTQAVSTVQVEEARANLATAAADLRGAELELERRTLRAPFAGHMGLAQISEGDRVTATTPVANIDDRGTILVRYSIPERFAGRTLPGSRTTATTISFGSRVFEGVVAEIDSRIDAQTRTLTVRAAIDNADDILRPGMAFLVETVFDGEIYNAVPLLSLQWDRNGSFVWQVVDGRARRTDVEIVERGSQTALVSGALTTADHVVLEGVQRLRDGSEVTVAERDEIEPGRS